MAASDNVVRAGFTPKYKDISTLTKMLTYTSAPATDQKMKPTRFQNCKHSTLYDPPIDEFSVVRTVLRAGEEEKMGPVQGPSLIIVTSGEGTIEGSGGGRGSGEAMKEGSVWFVGAGVGITVKSEKGIVTHRAFVEVE